MGTERCYAIALACCKGLEPSSLRKLVRGLGSSHVVWEADADALTRVVRLKDQTLHRLLEWRSRINQQHQIEKLETWLRDRGIECLVRGDADYPACLEDLAEPPLVLFLRGDKQTLQDFHSSKTVSIVGTRRASSYGLEAARWIATTLAEAGMHVVSGLALGVDKAAHESAMQQGGVSSCVLACGVDLCYPVNHKHLYDEIVKVGLAISEYPPGTEVAKHRFPERNRIIAALGKTTIVVQAGERSGALVTVEHALALGRDVYVVPGPITSQHHRGSNRLLFEGAVPLVDPMEFLVDQCIQPPGVGTEQVNVNIPIRWQQLYESLLEPTDATRLSEQLEIPLSHLYAGLLELELAGVIQRVAGGMYARKF